MTDVTHADLDSQVIDLTAVPLAELRDLTTSELVDALARTYAAAEFTTGDEAQVQNSVN